jgi:hypothetical protein
MDRHEIDPYNEEQWDDNNKKYWKKYPDVMPSTNDETILYAVRKKYSANSWMEFQHVSWFPSLWNLIGVEEFVEYN